MAHTCNLRVPRSVVLRRRVVISVAAGSRVFWLAYFYTNKVCLLFFVSLHFRGVLIVMRCNVLQEFRVHLRTIILEPHLAPIFHESLAVFHIHHKASRETLVKFKVESV